MLIINQSSRKGRFRQQQGIAMVYALFGASVSAAMLALLMANSSLDAQSVSVRETEVDQQYLAEAVLASASVHLEGRLANWYREDDWQQAEPSTDTVVESARERWALDAPSGHEAFFMKGVTMVPTGYSGAVGKSYHKIGWKIQGLGDPYTQASSGGAFLRRTSRLFELRVVVSGQESWQLVGSTDDPSTADMELTASLDQMSVGTRALFEGFEVDGRDLWGDMLAGSGGTRKASQRATVTRLFRVTRTPATQYTIFYEDDLEINPGPSMTVSGRVHSNGDLYLGCNNTLTMDTNHIRALGNMYRRRKDNTSSNGTVMVRKWVANPFDPTEPADYFRMESQSQLGSIPSNISGYDSAFTVGYDSNGDGDFLDSGDWLPFHAGALEYWDAPDGYVIPSEEEFPYTVGTGSAHPEQVGQVQLADIESIQAFVETQPGESGAWVLDGGTESYRPATGADAGPFFDPGYYNNKAGLKIIVDEDGTSWRAYSPLVTPDPMNPLEMVGWGDVTAEVAGAISLSTVPDTRQSTSFEVGVVEVDLEQLRTLELAYQASNGGASLGIFPANGLLYVGHAAIGTGSAAKGVLLTNGETLLDDLSVVTEGSLYIHGDYNLNGGTGSDPIVSAVIADAVNLLSNNWDGSKSLAGGLPVASETTYNVSLFTGNLPTVGSSYNGGFENLPRFHEKWSGVHCYINGSFIQAWENRLATGAWAYGGNRYKAPYRDWAYDQNLLMETPPFVPHTVEAVVVATF
ncbi:MAG TPA: hypothetical protein EYQ25_10185 [Planctomycetes bacterium]|nr:hypothetical protein [Planctomycetota bacterium]HIL38451.1 hypothetical protein [Planctomycetota bacterium]